MTVLVTSRLGLATARALDVTAGGRAGADAIGRLRAGVPRSLTWAPSLVILVPPAATLTGPTPDLDLLEAVVDRVAAAAGPGVRANSTRTRPAPAQRDEPERRAATAPDTPSAVRPAAGTSSAETVASVPRPRPLDAVVASAVAEDDGHPSERARFDRGRWTRSLDGRPLAHGAASALVGATSAVPVHTASMVSPTRLAHAASGPGAVADADPIAAPSAAEGASRSAPGPLASASAPRPVGAAGAAPGGAPTSAPGATVSRDPGDAPPSARAAGGSAPDGLRDLVQRWADPAPAPVPPPAPGAADPSVRRTAAAPVATDAVADGRSVDSRPAGAVDLLELGDALDELLAQEAETHGLDGRLL